MADSAGYTRWCVVRYPPTGPDLTLPDSSPYLTADLLFFVEDHCDDGAFVRFNGPRRGMHPGGVPGDENPGGVGKINIGHAAGNNTMPTRFPTSTPRGHPLSTGAIVGIVLAAVGVLLFGLALLYWIKRIRQPRATDHPSARWRDSQVTMVGEEDAKAVTFDLKLATKDFTA
jgi:hypothetical protein